MTKVFFGILISLFVIAVHGSAATAAEVSSGRTAEAGSFSEEFSDGTTVWRSVTVTAGDWQYDSPGVPASRYVSVNVYTSTYSEPNNSFSDECWYGFTDLSERAFSVSKRRPHMLDASLVTAVDLFPCYYMGERPAPIMTIIVDLLWTGESVEDLFDTRERHRKPKVSTNTTIGRGTLVNASVMGSAGSLTRSFSYGFVEEMTFKFIYTSRRS
ncbi:MAG: hypothetical protein HY460_02995 [Parcubacteria group bacterium]|nr:hypothetical protein [Parcubacteria group bacterium]